MPDVSSRLEAAALPSEDATGLLANLRRLVVRTVVDTFDDRVPGMAAEMAFYVVLSLPPLLLVVFGAVGFITEGLPQSDLVALQDSVLNALSTVLSPGTVDDVLRTPVESLLREGRGDILSLGIILTLWSASRSANVLLRTVVIAYDLADPRPNWQRRALAFGLTVAGAVIAVLVLPLLVLGPGIARQLLNLVGLQLAIAGVWPVLYWSGVVVVAVAALTGIYHVATGWPTPWTRDLPGAVLALVVWIAASAGIRVYTTQFASFTGNDAFQGLAAPLVLLLWVYASGIAVLLGAELNAEIERLWPTIDPSLTADLRDGPD